jgi:hypothetical protein
MEDSVSAELDQLKLKVQRILADEGLNVRLGKDGDYLVPWESTMVIVRPIQQQSNDPEKPGRLIVQIVALMNQNVPVSPALYEWLARTADAYMIGHVGMAEPKEGKVDLVYREALLGSVLDPEELINALIAVATVADDLDDEVKTKFGGERFVDPAS